MRPSGLSTTSGHIMDSMSSWKSSATEENDPQSTAEFQSFHAHIKSSSMVVVVELQPEGATASSIATSITVVLSTYVRLML